MEAYETDKYGPTGPGLPAVATFPSTKRAGDLLVGIPSLGPAFSRCPRSERGICARNRLSIQNNANSLDKWDNKSDWTKLAPEVLHKSEPRLLTAADCDKRGPLSAACRIRGDAETLKTGGLYWDVHVRKGWGHIAASNGGTVYRTLHVRCDCASREETRSGSMRAKEDSQRTEHRIPILSPSQAAAIHVTH
jgi:hypothetical protein